MHRFAHSHRAALFAFGLTCFYSNASLGAGYPVGGMSPGERPEGAPVITEYTKGARWYANALVGVTPPYPESLGFLEDQGAWFNPFTHPGMLRNYDLRGWHGTH